MILMSVSLNLTAFPLRDARMICLLPSVLFTLMSSSFSSRVIAIMPPFLGREYAVSWVFFMVPFLVDMMR